MAGCGEPERSEGQFSGGFISSFPKGELLISTRPKNHCGAAPGQLPVARRVSTELLRRLGRSGLEFQTLGSTEGPVSKPNYHRITASGNTGDSQRHQSPASVRAEDDAAARLRTLPRPPQVSQATGHALFQSVKPRPLLSALHRPAHPPHPLLVQLASGPAHFPTTPRPLGRSSLLPRGASPQPRLRLPAPVSLCGL